MHKEVEIEKIEFEERKFIFGSNSILFQRIKDVNSLPSDRLWALEWKSAFAFGDFLATCGSLNGFDILEIGAGSGLVGINCAILGGDVTITDRVNAAVELIKKNLSINNAKATVLSLDWNKLQEFPDKSFHLIIGSDVLYQSRNAEGISKLLSTKHLKDGGLSIIFCPGRGYATRLETLCNEIQGLKASAYYLYNVESSNCKMPELHIVCIKKGDLSSENEKIFQQLKEFVKKHGWETV